MNLFSHPLLLICLPLVLGLLIFIFGRSRKVARKRLQLLVSTKLLPRLSPTQSGKKEWIKFSLFCSALVFFILGLAGPQWGSKKRTVNPQGIDVLIAVDLSKSMLARDIRPNRLERVKLTLINSLNRVQGDRLGLIAFSGSSFLQCPLTLDHQAFAKTLSDLQVGLLPRDGTDLSSAIKEASSSFSKDDSDKFLILLSDGEDLEGLGLKQAKIAAQEGIKIFTIGIGSDGGARIPLDPLDQAPNNFLKTPQGEEVFTKLDENSLRQIAQITGGQYHRLGATGEGLVYVFDRLQSIGQQKKREQLSTELPIDRYQIFVILGLLFLLFESFSSSAKKLLHPSATSCFAIFFMLLIGCSQTDNIKLAESAMLNGKPDEAASYYQAEIDLYRESKRELDPKLLLNCGLAHFEANQLDTCEPLLQQVLDLSDEPDIQSIALNTLGNLHYRRANLALDQQNVSAARKSWNQALSFYESASQLDGNEKAQINLDSLQNQITQRIEKLVTVLSGKVWRDINGDGIPQDDEPAIEAKVFWDKDNNGELNATLEPAVSTNENGVFGFEWISGTYPSNLQIASAPLDRNQSDGSVLFPLFPPPPPPQNPDQVRNFFVSINEPGKLTIPLPYRAAPQIRGRIWNDQDGDGLEAPEEKGTSAATLFLDTNGNFQLDENETSFKPAEDGKFSQIAPPGQYSVCIQPDNPEANVTFPIEEHKAHLAWINFESPSSPLLFGLQDSGSGESSDSQNQQSDAASQADAQPSDEPSESQQAEQPQASEEEVNALYERLLQEMESKSKPLDQEVQALRPTPLGRDY